LRSSKETGGLPLLDASFLGVTASFGVDGSAALGDLATSSSLKDSIFFF
jgi:hypothetical protein